MKIVEINIILLAEVKTNIHVIRATDKFCIKSHARNITLNIHVCTEIIIDEMVVIQGGEGRERGVGVWRNHLLYLSLSNVFLSLKQCGIPNVKRYKTASGAMKRPEVCARTNMHACAHTVH